MTLPKSFLYVDRCVNCDAPLTEPVRADGPLHETHCRACQFGRFDDSWIDRVIEEDERDEDAL